VEAELLDRFVLPHSADSQYRNTLSTREDDPLYIDKTEQAIMASEQPKLIAQMRWVTRLTYFLIATYRYPSCGNYRGVGVGRTAELKLITPPNAPKKGQKTGPVQLHPAAAQGRV
jgi:hypothetical protein